MEFTKVENLESSTRKTHTQELLSPPLVSALRNVEQLKLLRRAGESFNGTDRNGNTLLHLAVKNRSVEVIDYLLTVDDIPKDAINSQENTALMVALQCDCEVIAMKLIEGGCDLRLRSYKMNGSLLHKAVKRRWIGVSESLIERGANLDSKTLFGKTPLQVACECGLVNEVCMLLFYGADASVTNSCGQNALDIAALRTSGNTQNILLDCLFRHVDTLHFKTLMYAMQNDKSTCSKLLENTKHVSYLNMENLLEFNRNIFFVKPDYFKLFIEKFPHIMEEIICRRNLNFFSNDKTACGTQRCIENLYILFESSLASRVVEIIKDNQIPLIGDVARDFHHQNNLEALTQLICCFLSYGVDITSIEVETIYGTYGYCELFKLMLHMDIQMNWLRHALLPTIIYDLTMTTETYWNRDYKYSLNSHLGFITIPPELKSGFLSFYSNLSGNVCSVKSRDRRAKIENLPAVASLLELARDRARAYIINKFRTRNCMQFYTVLKRLPIAEEHKKIISFERQIYSM